MSEQRPEDRPAPDACPSEETWSIYCDRELDASEVRRIEAHLERCAACGERVAELAAESLALRAAFQTEELAPMPASRSSAARSLALGAVCACAVAFVALSTLGWLFGNRLPAPLEWLDPFAIREPFALLFGLWSVLDQGGDLLAQFAAPVAALVLLVMTISAAVGRPDPQNGPRIAALLAALATSALGLMSPATAQAIDFRYGEKTVSVRADEVVEQSLVIQAETVSIEGTLRGDLIAIAERVIVSGVIEGDLVGGARRIEISGRVTGSVIAAGERVRISGSVDRNLYAATDQTSIAESGRVGQDLFGLGDGVEISGRVARDAATLGTWLDLRGEIGRDLAMRVERAELMAGARVGGDVRATWDGEENAIEIDPACSIGGETTLEPAALDSSRMWDRYTTREYYLFRIVSFAAAFAFGMVLFRLAPWVFGAQIRTAPDLFRSLGIGLAGIVLVPAALILLAVTVVGIPIALLGLAVFAAGIYAANVVVGALVGRALVRGENEFDWRGFARPLAAGLALVFVALALPYLGGLLRFVALLLGFGVVVERSWARYRA